VLVWGDRVFADSADIVEEASAKAPPQRQLFPEDPAAAAEVRELQNDFDIRLGPEGRRWPLPQPEELPAAMAATVRELRTHPAGARANDVPRRAALLSLGGVDRRPGGSQAIVSQKSLAATTSASTSASP
jgi:glutathione S-transferase